mmetsp:Transcript_338/g.797  ORF Transcript_338/g.797 Transcript_338/m.797 type:complete len:270 (+) Transcript_338:80-889(+)
MTCDLSFIEIRLTFTSRLTVSLSHELTSSKPIHGGNNILHLRQRSILQIRRIRHGNVRPRNPLHRSIQPIERIGLHHDCCNFRSNSTLRPSRLNRNHSPRLFDRVDNGLPINRTDRAKVNHLARRTRSSKNLRRLQSQPHHLGEGNNRHIRPLPLNLCLSNRNHKLTTLSFLTHGKTHTIHQLMLQNHHRVIIPNSRLHQPLGIFRVVRSHDLQPRHTRIPRRKALRMLGRRSGGISIRTTKYNGACNVPCTHVVLFGCRVDNLINRLH